VPFVNNSQNTDTGSLNKSYSYKNVGVILEVTPHINNNGDVALRIRAESSTVGVTYTDGVAIDTRNFRTDMTAKNGQTVVLGGINQKQRSEVVRKVPILGDIPVLGYLFKKKDSTSKEVELMVFLRPRVIRTVKQARELYEDVQKNSPLIRQWQQDNEPTDAPKSANENKKSKK
jgi:type II secretory pathway component GspD/PulD (secretin)